MSDKQIGIWGTIGAGKTTYLAALVAEFRRRPEWNIVGHKDAPGFNTRIVADFEDGRFPDPTDYIDPSDAKLLSYTVNQFGRFRSQAFAFTLIDIPGIVVAGEGELAEAYFEDLHSCNGMLLLLDPEARPGDGAFFGKTGESYAHSLTRLIEHLPHVTSARGQRVGLPLALCITKSDLDTHYQHVQNPLDYVRQLIGEGAWAALNNQCDMRNSVAAFSVSAVGRYATPTGHERPNIVPAPAAGAMNRFRVAVPTVRQPINVIEPVLWLLERM